MPQFQLLPQNPGFSQMLGQALGSGAGQGISESLGQFYGQRQKQQQTQQLLSALGLDSGAQQPSAMSQSPTPSESQAGLKLTPESVLAGTMMNPALGGALSKLYQTQQKEEQRLAKESQTRETAQEAFDEMSKILKEGQIGFGSKVRAKIPGKGGERAAEAVGEFESLSGALESILVDMVSRGTLSNARFKYITETLLPKPSDREATIKGKLKGLAKELKLDPSAIMPQKQMQQGFVKMQTPDGKVVNVPKNKAIEAQKAGGKLIQ